MAHAIDEALRKYANTEEQWNKYKAWCEYGSRTAAAEHTEWSASAIQRAKQAIQKNAAQHGYAPEHGWVHETPPGFKIKGTSTLRDMQTGEAKLVWEKTEVDKQAQETAMQEAVDALCESIPPLPPIAPPEQCAEDLMSIYPVGDHHIGMLAHAEEADENYDTKKAENILAGAIDYLVGAAPKSSEALVILLGDFLHYDSYLPLTEKSKNILDADSRYPRIVRAAMRAVRHAITRAAEKHQKVRVIICAGNHDASSMVFLREAMHCLYEDNERVEIDRSPKMFHYYKFGKSLIGAHHGDKVKMDKLPLLMATDCPGDWGLTTHRLILTGHVHHDAVKDFNGAKVESLRILAPADAYAYGSGYRTPRDMKRIDIHSEFGEVGRQTVTPEMIE